MLLPPCLLDGAIQPLQRLGYRRPILFQIDSLDNCLPLGPALAARDGFPRFLIRCTPTLGLALVP